MATVYANAGLIAAAAVGDQMDSIAARMATQARANAAPHNITGEEKHGIGVEPDGNDRLVVMDAEAIAAREFGHHDRGGGWVEGLHILGRLL